MVSSYNYVDKDARFVNVDACFGSLKETLCFGVEISIVFSDLWRTHLLAASSILLTLAPMQRRCHFIMAEIVFFLCKHSISANDVCDIFHLHATLPTSVRIHSVVDVIGLGQLSVGFLFNSPFVNLSHDFIYRNDLGILPNLSIKLLMLLFV